MIDSHDFAVIGGDFRSYYLADRLATLGYEVMGYGLDTPNYPEQFTIASSLEEAVAGATYVIGPIPFSTPDKNIFHKTNQDDMSIEHLFQSLHQDQMLLAGVMNKDTVKLCDSYKIAYHDLMNIDSLAIDNAIATAEGVIAEAIINQPLNLHGSRCLVLGYGRCAKVLADKLKALNTNTTVCARRDTDFALANSLGFKTLAFTRLPYVIDNYDLIFNTVPSQILTEKLLTKCNPSVAIYDIATAPGGVDFEAAKKMNINAAIYPGLPGKYSPRSSAIILVDHILNIIKKEGSAKL